MIEVKGELITLENIFRVYYKDGYIAFEYTNGHIYKKYVGTFEKYYEICNKVLERGEE